MRILTIAQPWTDCIVWHGKDVENRSMNIAGAYRGPVAIHAGHRYDDNARIDLRAAVDLRPRTELSHGAILGIVTLVDVHQPYQCMKDGILCSHWAEHSAHHLVIRDPRPLAEPIPFRGALGLRRPDDETIHRIEAAIA